MKRKRMTADQKKAAEIAALRARLTDILQGSWGGYSTVDITDGGSIHAYTSDEAFARYVSAVEYIWRDDGKPYLFSLNNLWHFSTLDSTAEYLHEHGCRA